MPRDDDGAERTRDVLARIADLLGCEASALADGDLRDGVQATADARELMLAWLDIEDPADRRRVLGLARALSATRTDPEPGTGLNG